MRHASDEGPEGPRQGRGYQPAGYQADSYDGTGDESFMPGFGDGRFGDGDGRFGDGDGRFGGGDGRFGGGDGRFGGGDEDFGAPGAPGVPGVPGRRGRGRGDGRDGQPGDSWDGDDYDDFGDGRADRDGRRGPAGRRGGRDGRDGRSLRDDFPPRPGRDDYGDDYDDYDSRDNHKVPKRRRGPVRRLAPWVALVVILVAIAVPVYYVYGLYQAKYHPPDYSGSGTAPVVDVIVPKGATASTLASVLVADGVVASDRAFVLAAEHSSDPTGLEPGTYKLKTHMQASLAFAALLNPKNRVQLTVTIPEGKRVAQVIAILAADMHVPVSDFETIVDNPPASLGLPPYAKTGVPGFHGIGYKVEGFLWPATYTIQPHETPLQVLQAMVAQFNQESQQQNLPAAAQKRGLNMEQLMIEASIVQAEAGNASQMPKIARVIENRFNAGMTLQFDSILEYGLGKFAVNIQDSWATIPGPYNDFLNHGLPPTPISNPGLDAIDAVLHPASGNWLYFLVEPDGKSVFCAVQPNQTTLACPQP